MARVNKLLITQLCKQMLSRPLIGPSRWEFPHSVESRGERRRFEADGRTRLWRYTTPSLSPCLPLSLSHPFITSLSHAFTRNLKGINTPTPETRDALHAHQYADPPGAYPASVREPCVDFRNTRPRVRTHSHAPVQAFICLSAFQPASLH